MLLALTVVVIIEVGQQGSAAAATGVAGVSSSQVTTVISGSTITRTVQAPGQLTTVTAPVPAGSVAARAVPTTGPTGTTGVTQADPNGVYADLASGDLPPGGAFAAKGSDTWHVVPGTTGVFGPGPVKLTYTVEVENGVEDPPADQEFATMVDATLADPRSWIGGEVSGHGISWQRIDKGTPSVRISLTSQLTERLNNVCGWQIPIEASCYARDINRVSINDARWARGAVAYNGDLGLYRQYAINHEVGHFLGYVHQPCGTDGGLAPVMMQQSWSVADNDLAPLNPQLVPMDGKVCKPNPYPHPLGPNAASPSNAPKSTPLTFAKPPASEAGG